MKSSGNIEIGDRVRLNAIGKNCYDFTRYYSDVIFECTVRSMNENKDVFALDWDEKSLIKNNVSRTHINTMMKGEWNYYEYEFELLSPKIDNIINDLEKLEKKWNLK